MDDDHKQTLGEKVAAVMEQEWDIQQGVTTSRETSAIGSKLESGHISCSTSDD